MFKWLSSDRPAPEALELAEKQQILDALEERYAEIQTEYATLQNALAAFKLRYWRRVGPLYARLDQVRAQIAAQLVRSAPRNEARQHAARAATAQARASAESLHEAEEETASEEFDVTDELKRLYRQAARLVHPDRADDEDDRSLRDEIMARINAAYRNGNGLAIESLIEEYQMRAEVGEEDAATRLIRTIRMISRLREQIIETEGGLATLRESELYRMQKTVVEAEARGIDKISEIALGLERQILDAEVRLERIMKAAAVAASAADEPVPSARAARRSAPVAAPAEAPATPAELRTARGEVVAREAERLVADLLNELGVAYRYKTPLANSPQDLPCVPDFTLRDGNGKAILWLHQPPQDSTAQREAWQVTIARYAALGFEPGIDLFVSRDEANGTPDPAKLRKLADFVCSIVS